MVKVTVDYDKDYDQLLLYRPNRKSEGGIEFTKDIIIDFAGGEVIGLEFLNASKFLTSLTGIKVTKDDLENMRSAKIEVRQKKDLFIIGFMLLLEKKSIEDRLTVPGQSSMQHPPILARS